MTREEADTWVYHAGVALGVPGPCIMTLSALLLFPGDPSASLARMSRGLRENVASYRNDTHVRTLLLFARRLAREVERSEAAHG